MTDKEIRDMKTLQVACKEMQHSIKRTEHTEKINNIDFIFFFKRLKEAVRNVEKDLSEVTEK